MAEVMVAVGSRVECDGARGTVKWIGEVPTTNGVWYGIDWDDGTRGKHDGSHQGIKYFETRLPKSGSFVRPAKVSSGITLEAAVRGRYQSDTTIEAQVTEQLQRTINARFVEVVGMEKIGKKQRKLETLETVVLDGWMVAVAGPNDLATLLPRLRDLDVSNSLLPSWEIIAQITRQLPSLRLLNISGNVVKLPENPEEVRESVCHISHVVLNNMMGYTWEDLMLCCSMFPRLRKLQVAFNKLDALGPVPAGLLDSLEELDIGVNPITSWSDVCHVGSLPRLENLNANNCKIKVIKFPETPALEKTSFFPNLKLFTVANNPLDLWESINELDKLPSLQELVLSFEEKANPYFQELCVARIANLMSLNRTVISPADRRDSELFYLKSCAEEYFSNGGKEDSFADLTPSFRIKHPRYAQLVAEHGAPLDESQHKNLKTQKLKDLKIELKIVTPDDAERAPCLKTFLPSTKVSKLKMMLKRQLRINPAANLKLSYSPVKNKEIMEIPMENDMKEMEYYSILNGDSLLVRW